MYMISGVDPQCLHDKYHIEVFETNENGEPGGVGHDCVTGGGCAFSVAQQDNISFVWLCRTSVVTQNCRAHFVIIFQR